MQSTNSFLSLAPEIRNNVYTFCTPVNGHIRDYGGLFLSCKQVKHEFEGKVIAVMTDLISSTKREFTAWYGTDLSIRIPQTLADLQALEIDGPRSQVLDTWDGSIPWNHPDDSSLSHYIRTIRKLHLHIFDSTSWDDSHYGVGQYQSLFAL